MGFPTREEPQSIIPAKVWWKSKTLWVNFIALLAVVVPALLGNEDFARYVGEGAIVILTAVNILLRAFATKQPVTFHSQ